MDTIVKVLNEKVQNGDAKTVVEALKQIDPNAEGETVAEVLKNMELGGGGSVEYVIPEQTVIINSEGTAELNVDYTFENLEWVLVKGHLDAEGVSSSPGYTATYFAIDGFNGDIEFNDTSVNIYFEDGKWSVNSSLSANDQITISAIKMPNF